MTSRQEQRRIAYAPEIMVRSGVQSIIGGDDHGRCHRPVGLRDRLLDPLDALVHTRLLSGARRFAYGGVEGYSAATPTSTAVQCRAHAFARRFGSAKHSSIKGRGQRRDPPTRGERRRDSWRQTKVEELLTAVPLSQRHQTHVLSIEGPQTRRDTLRPELRQVPHRHFHRRDDSCWL